MNGLGGGEARQCEDAELKLFARENYQSKFSRTFSLTLLTTSIWQCLRHPPNLGVGLCLLMNRGERKTGDVVETKMEAEVSAILRSVGLVPRACYHWLGAFPPGIVRHDCIHPSLNIIYGRLREPKIEGRGQKMALVHRNVMRDSKSWPCPNNALKPLAERFDNTMYFSHPWSFR